MESASGQLSDDTGASCLVMLSFHMWALFGHMQAVVIRMPIIWLKFLAPELVFFDAQL